MITTITYEITARMYGTPPWNPGTSGEPKLLHEQKFVNITEEQYQHIRQILGVPFYEE
jgi:hypothetical protein